MNQKSLMRIKMSGLLILMICFSSTDLNLPHPESLVNYNLTNLTIIAKGLLSVNDLSWPIVEKIKIIYFFSLVILTVFILRFKNWSRILFILQMGFCAGAASLIFIIFPFSDEQIFEAMFIPYVYIYPQVISICYFTDSKIKELFK